MILCQIYQGIISKGSQKKKILKTATGTIKINLTKKSQWNIVDTQHHWQI